MLATTRGLRREFVVNKNTIPKKIFAVNPANSIMLLGKDMVNPINAEIKRAAEMLIDNPEYALSPRSCK